MPIYEYTCPKCGKEQEMMQKFGDSPPICPNLLCQEGDPIEMVRQISQSSFRLKGSGWYKTDYSSKK